MDDGCKNQKRNQLGELVEETELTIEHWEDRWDKGLTRFHMPVVHPMLNKYYDQMTEGKESQRILVPCCGKSVDLKWLADRGHEVVGVEVAELGCKQFYEENNLEYSVHELGAVNGKKFESKSTDCRVTIYCCDLFKVSRDAIGTFNCIWDRGSLSAINVSDRKRYAQVMVNVMTTETNYLLSTFLVDHQTFAGPPNQCSEEDVQHLYGQQCALDLKEKRDVFGPWQRDTWKVDYFYELIHILKLKK